MDEGSGTRSSLLWQVSRILKEMSELNQLPDCLVMENVIQVDSHENAKNMEKWQDELSKLGYKSYIKHLKATDFGIPQTRNRCFMVSVLGDYSYQFPRPKPLKSKLKDFLVGEVDEKYYLTQNEINAIQAWKSQVNPIETAKTENDDVLQTTTAKGNTTNNAMMLLLKEPIKDNIGLITRSGDFDNRKIQIKDGKEASTIRTSANSDGGQILMLGFPIKKATKQGYEIAKEGDGVYVQNIKGKRGTVQHDKIQTIKASPDIGVVTSYHYEFNKVQKSDNAHTIQALYSSDYPSKHGPVVGNIMRLRRLVPLECWRLMGVKDSDYCKVKGLLSENTLYHLAGDSIVVPVLMALFGQMLDVQKDWWFNGNAH